MTLLRAEFAYDNMENINIDYIFLNLIINVIFIFSMKKTLILAKNQKL